MIETSPFGKTGHQSTRVLFGAAALGGMKQDKADGVLEVLLEYGINHIDTAASYGESELRIGPWMREHRKRFFLATKTGDRTYQGARDSLHRSLERLRVDQVDLIQMHNLVAENEWTTALWERAARSRRWSRRARKGWCASSALPVTARRSPRCIAAASSGSPSTRCCFPYNFTMLEIKSYEEDVEALLKVCREREVATQTIKSVARRRWQNGDGRKFSWYEPLRDRDAIRRGVHFVLSRPGLFLNTSSDATLLRDILDAASMKATLPARAEMEADVEHYAMEPLFIPGVSDTI